jgi:iduronate 2-sulfatase
MGKLYHVGHGNTEDPASWSVPHYQAKTVDYVLPENRVKRSREEAMFENQNPANLPRGAAYESADVPDETYADGKIAAEAIKRLQAAKERQEPFYIAVGFLKPHLPFCAPKKYWDLYDPAAFKLAERTTPPDGAPAYAPTNWGELRNYANVPDKGPISEEGQRTLIHGYYAAVSYMDAQLGRVLDELDRLGQAANTIIVLWGDHGWHLGDHGMWSKHSNYEQAARQPLIIVAPGTAKPGGRTGHLVETVDIYPTLCELAGVKAPTNLEGRSVVPALKDPSAPTKEFIFHVFPRGERLGRAVRTEQHRLVEWKVPGAAPETAELELYDYKSDPGETRNLAVDQPQTVSRLRAILAAEPEALPQIRSAAGTDRAKLFRTKDKDGDQKLTLEEFMANQSDPDQAKARFTKFDTNKDGLLSRDEFVKAGQ